MATSELGIDPNEISAAIRRHVTDYKPSLSKEEVGYVREVGDGIAGLHRVRVEWGACFNRDRRGGYFLGCCCDESLRLRRLLERGRVDHGCCRLGWRWWRRGCRLRWSGGSRQWRSGRRWACHR